MVEDYTVTKRPVGVAPKPKISINQLTDFIASTDAGKQRIIKGQKYPKANAIPISYYRVSNAALSRCILNDFDMEIIRDVIDSQRSLKIDPTNKQALTKRANQVSALENFLTMGFPKLFADRKFTFASSPRNFRRFELRDVTVIVSPDILIRWMKDGQKYIGAIKFDIHKDPLDFTIGSQRAALLAYFLDKMKAEDEIVDERYCMSVDVRNHNIFRPLNVKGTMPVLEKGCVEVAEMWRVA